MPVDNYCGLFRPNAFVVVFLVAKRLLSAVTPLGVLNVNYYCHSNVMVMKGEFCVVHVFITLRVFTEG